MGCAVGQVRGDRANQHLELATWPSINRASHASCVIHYTMPKPQTVGNRTGAAVEKKQPVEAADEKKKRPVEAVDEIDDLFADFSAKKKQKAVKEVCEAQQQAKSEHVYRQGYLVKGNDHKVCKMTVEQAFSYSQKQKDCAGFCFQAPGSAPKGKVELFFKSRTYPDGVEQEDNWHTFLKKGFAKKVRDREGMADVRGVHDLTKMRKLTEEGFKIYGEDELKLDEDPKAIFTADCPFDCQCCF